MMEIKTTIAINTSAINTSTITKPTNERAATSTPITPTMKTKSGGVRISKITLTAHHTQNTLTPGPSFYDTPQPKLNDKRSSGVPSNAYDDVTKLQDHTTQFAIVEEELDSK